MREEIQRPEITGPRRLVLAGVAIALVGVVVLNAEAAPNAPNDIGVAVAEELPEVAAPARKYLPLEWNGARRPITFDHMFMSERRMQR